MSGDEYRSGDVFENVRAIAADLDHRWPSMHREPVAPTQRRDAHGRFAPLVPSARDLVDTAGIRATLAKHLAWDESRNPPLFEEALKAVEKAS